MINAKLCGRLLLLFVLLSLSSCGGQGGSLTRSAPESPGTGLPVTSKTLAQRPGIDLTTPSWVGNRQDPAAAEMEQSNTELPQALQGVARIPVGPAELGGQVQKITSALQDLDPTLVFADSGDITINASSISLNPDPGALSWAMYQISLPDEGYPSLLRFTVDNFSGGGSAFQGYYILVSNYTTGRWMMSDIYTTSGNKNITLPTVDGNLVPQNYLSPLGNLYVALLAHDDVQVTLGGMIQDTNTRPQALIVEADNIYVRSTTEEFQFRNEGQDSDNGIASQSWDFDEDDIEDSAISVVNHTYDTPGLHEVRLTVWDHNGGWDKDTLYVYTYDTDESLLPDEFMEALNEADPDPLPPPDIPLPELGYDQTFERLLAGPALEWWEIPGSTDNVSWKGFNDQDSLENPYSDMRCFLPQFGSYYYDDHTEVLPFSNALGRTVGNWQDMQGIVQTGAWLHGVGVVNEGIVDDLDEEDPLAFAIKRLMNDYPDPLHDATFAQIQAEVAGVPDDFQQALGRLVNAIHQAKPYHEAFLDGANTQIFGVTNPAPPPEGWRQSTFDNALGMVVAHDNGGPIIAYAVNGLIPANFDYADLFQGASVLTAAIDEFHAFLDGWTPGASFDFEVRTSLGNISVTGDGDDVISLPDWDAGTDNGFYMLQVDIGGNDDYFCHAGGNAALDNPIAICIDYSGDDEYFALDDPDDVDRTFLPSNDNTHQQGSGRMGYGILLDLSGNDDYGSVRLSQGCSDFGVGILQDVGGNDNYGGEAMCQGASLVGIGVLLDGAGIDNYTSTAYSQGFGSFRGIGILSDRGIEDDTYYAEPLFNMARPEYDFGDGINNLNFCQGAALGKQPSGDALGPDPFIGSGGLGLLNEEGGSETYTSGTFSQACAFMEGTGLLLEHAGADTYNGLTSCGSFSARRAVSMLWDYNGADQYLYTGERNLAAATIYSVAWLFDAVGADTYESDNTALGSAQVNSFCYFVDFEGADGYELFSVPMRPSLGSAYIGEFDPGGFDITPTLGLFLDIIGGDTYVLPENVLDRDGVVLTVDNDSVWVRSKHSALEPGWHDYEYGVGADGAWLP